MLPWRDGIIMDGGRFWSMLAEEREGCSPEVRRVDWLDIADVVDMNDARKGPERLENECMNEHR